MTVASRRAEIAISVRLSDRVARRQIFIPMHYREAAVNLLTNPALDPYAHIPEFKVCAVSVTRATKARRMELAEDASANGEVADHLALQGD